MKRTSRLLGALLALCLLLSLLSLPAMAEPVQYTSPDLAESAYREEFAKTGGWPPELIGSWVGYYFDTWGCWSFYADGRHILTNFNNALINRIGTSKTLEPADEATFETTEEGKLWHLYDNGSRGEFRKVGMPWVRLKAQEEAVAAGMDPMLEGTFAGTLDGVYTEWTFHGDGRFTQVIPYEDLSENGTFLAGEGNLVILLNEKIIQYPYQAMAGSLALKIPDKTRWFFKKTGPLVQIPNQWRTDWPRLVDAAYREEFAETGGWPPESIGSWVGQGFMGECGQFSFYPDGRYTQTVFSSPSINSIGTSKTLEAADKHYAEGDIMHIEDHGSSTDARRVSMPYARMKFEKETPAAGVDPAILGTFGGWLDGLYTEWTFHGDGRLTQVTPFEESTVQGTFLTGDGTLAILLNGKMTSCAYRALTLSLILTLPDSVAMFEKKGGPLVQVPEHWSID